MKEETLQFINFLTANGLSKSTINSYGSFIDDFFSKFEVMNENNVNQYFIDRAKTDVIANGIHKAFSKYAIFKNIEIRLPKYRKHIRKPFDIFDWNYFENEIIPTIDLQNSNSEQKLKKKAILYFMAYTGLRRIEVATIKRSDIKLDIEGSNLGMASVYMPKVKKYRTVYFSEAVKNLLKAYFMTEAEADKGAFNITAEGISALVARLKELHPKYNLNPKIFRHVYSNEKLNHTGNLMALKEDRGDTSINTTAQYLHITEAEKMKVATDMFDKMDRSKKLKEKNFKRRQKRLERKLLKEVKESI